jgi:hypothetical protein
VVVETESAVYVIDEPNGVLRRYPRENLVNHGMEASKLRMDTQSIPYRLHPHFPLEVGEPAVFILNIRNDGVETIRTTTPVVSIRA